MKNYLFLLLLIPQVIFAQPIAPLEKIQLIQEHADTIQVLRSYPAEPLVLTAIDSEKKITLYTIKDGTVKKLAERPSLGHIWQAALYETSKHKLIILAYGLGRGDLNAPLRLVSYDLSLENETTIHTFPTERSQMNQLIVQGDKIWASYFVSKYETETGTLTTSDAKNWNYEKSFSIRMGTQVAVNNNQIAIGRVYGDVQGQDGDVLLKDGNNDMITLPSYRGVSSLTFVKSTGGTPAIMIGDGWHSNYGQLAQARLSILNRIPNTNRYALELLHIFKDSYAISQIIPISKDSSSPLILESNNRVILAKNKGSEWNFSELYKQQNQNQVFSVGVVGQNASTTFVIINDDSLNLYSFKQ